MNQYLKISIEAMSGLLHGLSTTLGVDWEDTLTSGLLIIAFCGLVASFLTWNLGFALRSALLGFLALAWTVASVVREAQAADLDDDLTEN